MTSNYFLFFNVQRWGKFKFSPIKPVNETPSDEPYARKDVRTSLLSTPMGIYGNVKTTPLPVFWLATLLDLYPFGS